MKNVIAIIQAHGGLEALKREHIRIEPPSSGYMRLTIEHVGTGLRRGTSHISVAHYYEQEGDLMQDPEMVLQVPDTGWDNSAAWEPVFFQQANPPIYQEAMTAEGVRPNLSRDLKTFATIWDKNIGEQGYPEAYAAQKGGGESSPG